MEDCSARHETVQIHREKVTANMVGRKPVKPGVHGRVPVKRCFHQVAKPV